MWSEPVIMCRGCPIGTERPSPWRNRDLVRARHQCASMGVNTTGSAAHLGGSPGPVPFYLHEVAWGQSRSRAMRNRSVSSSHEDWASTIRLVLPKFCVRITTIGYRVTGTRCFQGRRHPRSCPRALRLRCSIAPRGFCEPCSRRASDPFIAWLPSRGT